MYESVTVIIATYNEEKYIKKCIDSIINQNYPQELIEILVVDGMSKDDTITIVREMMNAYRNIKILQNPKSITPISFNIGIKNSKADVIIILGGHSFIDKNFIKNNVRNLYEKDADCSGGTIETINDSELGEDISAAMSCPFGVGNALFRYSKEETYVDTVAFGAYKRTTLNKIGYFDEEFVRNQDDEINLRLTEAGGKILLSPDIKSWYYSRSSFRRLWKQYYQYGFWKVRVIQKHKKPASLRHLVPITFVMSIIFLGIGSIISKYFLYLLFVEMSLYAILDICFSTKLSRGKKFKSIATLFIIFPILHLSYGLGFLAGIFNFYVFKSKKLIDKNTEVSR